MSASRIAPKLYQGSVPPYGSELSDKGFHTLVLCAIEIQPPHGYFIGLPEVLRCPFDDSHAELSKRELERIHVMARQIAERVKQAQRTLVTCHMGLNRSGLVTALALTEIYGCSGAEAVKWVQKERSGALFNPRFVSYLERVQKKHPSATPAPPISAP